MSSGKVSRLTIRTLLVACTLAVSSLAALSARSDNSVFSAYSPSRNYTGTQILSPEACNNGIYDCTGQTFYEKDLTRLPPLADTYPLDMVFESFMYELPIDDYVEKLTEVLNSVSLGATGRGGKALLRYMASAAGGPIFGFSKDFAQRVVNLFVSAKEVTEEPNFHAMAEEAVNQAPTGFLYNLSGVLNNIPNKVAFFNLARQLPGVLRTRSVEYLYYAGLQEDAIDFMDDTFAINRLVHIQMVIPTASKNLLGAAMNYTQDYLSGQIEPSDGDALSVMQRKSATQPYIDISPKWAPQSGFYVGAYMKALISLQYRMPEGSKLRLFPTTTADGQHLTCEVVFMYPDENGALKYSPVLEIIRDWGSPDSASWLTDRIAQRNLVAKDLISYRDKAMDYLWGSPSSLPVFNPIDAEMIQILADLVKEYLQNPDEQCEYCNNFDFRDYPTPRHADVKQSGYYMAAVDAGDMVFYTDMFASQETASPRITMKRVSFDKVDAAIMTRLDIQRINRYASVLRGIKPFDPVNKQLEMAFLKLLVSQVTTNFGESGIREIIGADPVDFPHPVLQSIYGSLIRRR